MRAITSHISGSFNDLFDASIFVDSQFITWEKSSNQSWRDSSYEVDVGTGTYLRFAQGGGGGEGAQV